MEFINLKKHNGVQIQVSTTGMYQCELPKCHKDTDRVRTSVSLADIERAIERHDPYQDIEPPIRYVDTNGVDIPREISLVRVVGGRRVWNDGVETGPGIYNTNRWTNSLLTITALEDPDYKELVDTRTKAVALQKKIDRMTKQHRTLGTRAYELENKLRIAHFVNDQSIDEDISNSLG